MPSLRESLLSGSVPAPDPVVEALEESWQALSQVGTWLTAEQRVDVAREARVARDCAVCRERAMATSPYAVERHHVATGLLSAATVDVVHRISVDPGRLSSRWYRELGEAGISDAELVEITGVISTVVSVDTLCVGLGAVESLLPDASDAAVPSKQLPAGAAVHSAWVETVVPERAEGELADYYREATSGGFVPNVFRSLTLVPAEAMRHRRRAVALYPAALDLRDPELRGALARPQMELIAATVSSINDCFY